MPRPTKGPRLGGGPAHERLLLNNLAASLFTHKAVTTTQTKAKRVQPVAEKLVSLAKRGDLHARRQAMADITDKNVVHELFTNIAPLVQDRPGGYTRITKLGFRKGDNAPMALIELVLEPVSAKPTKAKSKLVNAVKGTAAAVVAEEVVEHTGVETLVDENIVEEAVVEAPAEVVAEAPVAEVVQEAPAETVAEEAAAETVAEEAPVETVAEVVAEEAPVEEAAAEAVVEEAPVAEVAAEETPAEEEAAVAEAEAEAGETPKADEAE
ncbi:MAG: 50S ribosomal protein L17 [Micrococcales bacterium]|nr:50S ribosomal protein L17 [Micrococcales bacterium]